MNTIYAAILAAVLSLAGGTYLGYELAVGRAIKAETSLELLKASAKNLQKEADSKAKAFEESLAKVQADSKAVLAGYAKDMTTYKDAQVQLVAQKDAKIKTLQGSISLKEQDLASLKTRLASAVSDKERAELQASITLQEKALLEERLRKQGLECLTVPVPQEYLDNLNKLKTEPLQ